MRKNFLIIFFLMLITSIFALPVMANEYQYYCPKEPYNISGNFKGFISSISGTNFLTRQLIEKIVSNGLKNEYKGKFNVHFTSFFNNSILDGKFKSLSIDGYNIEQNGFHISEINAKTLCGFNHVKREDKNTIFKENMVIQYSAKITADDLKKTLNSNEYLSAIKGAKIKSTNKTLAKIIDVDIDIKNNKIIMSCDLLLPVLFGDIPTKLSFSSGLGIKNGKIVFNNVRLRNSFNHIVYQLLDLLLERINPFTYNMQTKENHDIILNVENVKIENNEIYTDGTLVILKNYNN